MGYFLAVAATVIWAGNFIVARALNQDILPIGLAFWRWAIAVATLAPCPGILDLSPCCVQSSDRPGITLCWGSFVGGGVSSMESGDRPNWPFSHSVNLLSDSGFQWYCCVAVSR